MWLVRSTPERVVQVWALARDIVLCSWARHLTLTVPLSSQVYKWVPAICWGNVTNCGGVTCDGLASHPGGVEILLAASCYRNRDKLRHLWVIHDCKASLFIHVFSLENDILALSTQHAFLKFRLHSKWICFRDLKGSIPCPCDIPTPFMYKSATWKGTFWMEHPCMVQNKEYLLWETQLRCFICIFTLFCYSFLGTTILPSSTLLLIRKSSFYFLMQWNR